MNGAESLVKTLLEAGVDTCFANPGTSEMHFVAALDRCGRANCVLGLHENVVTGMADGYFRIAKKPASTLLHCGPGFANGMANLHNARRANSGIVNIVGDHATYHRRFDAPLTSDTEGMARTVSHWVRVATEAKSVGSAAVAAVEAARSYPGQIATLILPADASWGQGGVVAKAIKAQPPWPVDPMTVRQAARTLRQAKNVLLLLGGSAVTAHAQKLAARIAAATDAHVMASFTVASVARGRGRMALERVPYSGEAAVEALRRFQHIILVSTVEPVAFFAYPGKPSTYSPADAQIQILSRVEQDGEQALQALVDELAAPQVPHQFNAAPLAAAKGAPTPQGLAQTLAALIPDDAIISDESVSYGRGFYEHTHGAAPHDWLHLTGGAIGDGMPVAAGAAIGAGRTRRVISLQADGSAMYSIQALWTQARERLPVTTILLNNRSYNILMNEYRKVGAEMGATGKRMLRLSDPDFDWVKVAEGFGVEAAQATTLERCGDLIAQSLRRSEPFLIDLVL